MTKKELLDLFELHNVQDDDDIYIALCEDDDIAPIEDINRVYKSIMADPEGFVLIAGIINEDLISME